MGEVELWGGNTSYRLHDEFHRIHAGANEITIQLTKACGIVLRVEIDGASAPFNTVADHLRIKQGDREIAFARDASKIELHEPGIYEIQLDPIAGFAPVDPVDVSVQSGEYIDHIVRLKKIR